MLFERKNNTEQETRLCGIEWEWKMQSERLIECLGFPFRETWRTTTCLQVPQWTFCQTTASPRTGGVIVWGPNPQHISNLRLWTSLVARRSRRFHNRFMDAWKMGLGFKDSMLLLQVMIFTHGTDFSGLFRGLFGFEYAAGRLRSVHTRTLQPNLGYSLKLLNYPLFFNEIILRICLLSSSFLIRQMYI